MKTKLLTLCLALFVATNLFASETQVDGIWYNFYSSTKTATVTYRGNYWNSYNNEYSGSVVIPETVNYNSTTYSVTTIGDDAFRDCSGLASVTIPNSVTSIGGGAFEKCTGLTSITIPNSVTTIGEYAFSECINLEEVNGCENVIEVGGSAFENTLWFLDQPDGVLYIGKVAYKYKGSMPKDTQITIKEGTLAISPYAFYECSGLTSVSIPNSVTSIGGRAFSGCSGLTSVTIGNSVTTIGNSAFSGCSSLTSVTIPYSVTTIGDGAFASCKGLTSVAIPNSVTWIGVNAFAACTGLKGVYISDLAAWCKIDFQVNYTYWEFGSNPLGCAHHLYLNNQLVTDLEIPNSVTTIGDFVFYGCSGLTSVTIPNSVTTIENSAFRDCSGLTSVTIPNSVRTIEKSAFRDCSGLASVTCYAENPPSCGSDCFYGVPKYIPIYILYYASKSAYKSAEGWKEFTNISLMYFDVCGDDLRWKYEEGTLSISGTGEMFDFTQTDSPWLDLKDSVTNIVFPSNITSIGKYAFYGFSKLTSVTIPNSVTTIGEFAFSGCSGLTSVTIPNSVTTIGEFAFNGCSGLTSVTIPNSVTTIGESAFENCTYLKTITLGKSLTDIGCNAFKGDSRVEEITSYAEVTPNVCSSTFDGLSKQYIYLYVPENSIRGYQVDPNWNGFDIRTKAADKKPIDGENPIVTPSDQDVTITWPITDGTDTYTLTISKNGETVCVLTFNANGQLTNIAFAAPGHNGAHQAPAATLTAQGYQFTVTGLNPGTAYDYSVTATDAGGKTIAVHKGNFSTTGGTGFKSVHGSQSTMHKYFHNGNLIIERNGVKYTATGQKVR